MPPPTTPKKSKSTEAKTYDPEPMKGLSPSGNMSSSDSDDEDYSPVKSVDIGESLTESEKAEKASVSARQEELSKAIGRAKGGKSRRKHKKAKKVRKTRKAKKHGKRRH